MRKKEILVAEDDSSLASTIKTRLELEEEFAVHLVADGAAALRSISVSVPDALVLDTGLRDVGAEDICRLIRQRDRTARLPVILLGVHGEGISVVDGLALGADDYVAKPFEAEELQARLKAVLRRHVHQPHNGADEFSGQHLRANFKDVHVTVDGRQVSLTKREFELLRFLVHHHNEVMGRDEILTNVWGADGWDERIVDSAMWKLRKKIGRAGRQIETVTGFGYRFNEPSKPQGES
jgi:two-component system, OmpR family, phosphate regulon response regulator PhoB